MALMAFGLAAGCGGSSDESKEPITLGQVPPEVVKAAAKKLPEVTFNAASRGKNGGVAAFELQGKDKAGKTRKLEIAPDGKILSVE